MAHFVTRRALGRRTFLAGAGALVALPWLDAMTPAFGKPAARPTRSVFCFFPNGAKMDDWFPKSGVTGSKTLASLKPLRKSVLLIDGVAVNGARALGDGPGDHARNAASFLTCAHPKKTGGADIHVGTSIDQVIAQQIGSETRFPSLELGMEKGRAGGNCDSGYSCAYVNNASWRSPTQPNTKEASPRAAFERLFGSADSVEGELVRRKRLAEQKSILDTVIEDSKRLAGKLGKRDARKMREYLDAVRELEKRLEKSEKKVPVPEMPKGLLTDHGFAARLQQMYDIIALAFGADLTRTISFMLGNGGSNISYRSLGVSEGHHHISHHGNEEEKLAQIQKIDQFHVEQFAKFLTRLEETDEGGKSLLYRSQIIYGSAIADGNRHNHENLPVLLCGRGNGKIKSGRRVKASGEKPLANLYLSMLRVLGLRDKSFGDSDGTLL